MWYLVIKAYLQLMLIEWYMTHHGFKDLYTRIRGCKVQPRQPGRAFTCEQICFAVDIACVWYWKEVLCLQRSAAAVCLLRNYGISAKLTIGTQINPFRAHAWVEVNNAVVTDRPYMAEKYLILDRC
jgi:hypothetical protein